MYELLASIIKSTSRSNKYDFDLFSFFINLSYIKLIDNILNN